MKKFYLFILFAYILGIVSWVVVSERIKTPVKPENKETVSTSVYPNLPLGLKYFNEKDTRWGSGNKMAAFDNKTVFQSYPTINCTIKAYSNEERKIKTKSLDEALSRANLLDGISNEWEKTAKEAYDNWGSIVTHYLPDDLVENIEKFDVDGDSKQEMIVTYNFFGRADGGSARTDIVKDDTIIFSVGEDQSYISPADTNDGFFVEWRISDDTPRCCPEGYRRTRFVFQDRRFIPLYEQEIRYMKVGEDNFTPQM